MRRARADKLPRPFSDLVLIVGIMPLHRCSQVRRLVGVICEWISEGPFVDLEVGGMLGRVVEMDAAIELEFVRGLSELQDRDAVAEHVVYPPHLCWFWDDAQGGIDQPLVVAVPRPEYEPVLPEANRPGIAIGGDVFYREDWHQNLRCVLRTKSRQNVRPYGFREQGQSKPLPTTMCSCPPAGRGVLTRSGTPCPRRHRGRDRPACRPSDSRGGGLARGWPRGPDRTARRIRRRDARTLG